MVRGVVRALGRSYRLRQPAHDRGLDRVAAGGEPAILTLWHDQSLLALEPLLRVVRKGLPVTLMVSHSRDGELARRVILPWGARVVRGSTSRGGQAGLRALYREIVQHGSSPVILPDGPRGPRHEVKPGVVVLSQMSRAPILPLAFAAASCWRLRSWDRLAVGRPFTTIAFACGEPRHLPRELDDERRREECRRLAAELERLTDEAQTLAVSRREPSTT